jgi:hypothetical protein
VLRMAPEGPGATLRTGGARGAGGGALGAVLRMASNTPLASSLDMESRRGLRGEAGVLIAAAVLSVSMHLVHSHDTRAAPLVVEVGSALWQTGSLSSEVELKTDMRARRTAGDAERRISESAL